MPTRKLWNYAIEKKKKFVLRKKKVYLLSRKEKNKIYNFISKQLRKGYIRPLKSPQIVPIFFVGKKDQKEAYSIEL